MDLLTSHDVRDGQDNDLAAPAAHPSPRETVDLRIGKSVMCLILTQLVGIGAY